jgi:cytochrome c
VENRQGREGDQWARSGLSRSCCCWRAPRSRSRRPYGIGRTPTAEEIRAVDISISPTGEEFPPGHGNAKEGAELFVQKGCVGCHGPEGTGGLAPTLKSKTSQDLPIWKRERILPLHAPFATTVWDFIHRGMPLGNEGSLTADEAYALTAYQPVPY